MFFEYLSALGPTKKKSILENPGGVAARGLVNGRSRTVHENVRGHPKVSSPLAVEGILWARHLRLAYMGYFADKH